MFLNSKKSQNVSSDHSKMPSGKKEPWHTPDKRSHTARRHRPVSQNIFKSSWAFREALCANGNSPKRTITVTTSDGMRKRFSEVKMDGNCGFQAVATGLEVLGILNESEATHTVVRERLMFHVRDEDVFYAQQIASWCQMESESVSEDEAWDVGLDSVERFIESVTQEGMQGHWLGSMWGGLELMALSRAFGVQIEVFTYCTLKQEVKKYEEHNADGEGTVSLFFAGCASGGHFDLLLPDLLLIERFVKWSGKVGNHMVTKCRPVVAFMGRLVVATLGLILMGAR